MSLKIFVILTLANLAKISQIRESFFSQKFLPLNQLAFVVISKLQPLQLNGTAKIQRHKLLSSSTSGIPFEVLLGQIFGTAIQKLEQFTKYFIKISVTESCKESSEINKFVLMIPKNIHF